MTGALVLNGTFEPICVVPGRRAICLVLAGKADLIESDGGEVRSERLTMARPFIIRLRYVVKVPYVRRTALSRRAVFARDDHRCQYCGATADSIDHVVPRSVGASTRGTTWWPRAGRATSANAIARWRSPACASPDARWRRARSPG